MQAGVLQDLRDGAHDVQTIELHGREVYGDAQRHAGVLTPAVGDGTRPPQHPLADRDDQAGFFGQRDEVRWGDEAPLVLPAQQRLGAGDAATGAIELRLVVQAQLVALQGVVELVFKQQGVRRGRGHALAVDLNAVAAIALGLVHGQVGVAHQRDRVRAVLRVERQADAGGHAQLMFANLHRGIEHFVHLGRHQLPVGLGLDARQQHHELVTP